MTIAGPKGALQSPLGGVVLAEGMMKRRCTRVRRALVLPQGRQTRLAVEPPYVATMSGAGGCGPPSPPGHRRAYSRRPFPGTTDTTLLPPSREHRRTVVRAGAIERYCPSLMTLCPKQDGLVSFLLILYHLSTIL